MAARTANPTYVSFSPSGKVLYAANEIYTYEGKATGAVSAFSIDPADGKLTLLNELPTGGTGTCYVHTDHSGHYLLAANFGSGSGTVFPLAPDGSLRPASAFEQDSGSGPNPRQAGPHAHSFNFSPDDHFAIESEFGTDRLMIYRFNEDDGTLTPNDPPYLALKPGSAPRHLAFNPSGLVAYSLNEIDSTLTVMDFDPEVGMFQVVQDVSTLPPGYTGKNTAAEVVVDPSGHYLYASNRGANTIAVFSIDEAGRIESAGSVPCGGRTPRGFGLDPTGRWMIVANQDTNNIAVFRIDPATGMPAPTGQSLPVPSPDCAKFQP